MKTKLYLSIIFLSITNLAIAQTATVKGTVKDTFGNPIENVSITYEETGGVTSDSLGVYSIQITAKKKVKVIFSHISFTTLLKTFIHLHISAF